MPIIVTDIIAGGRVGKGWRKHAEPLKVVVGIGHVRYWVCGLLGVFKTAYGAGGCGGCNVGLMRGNGSEGFPI